MRKIIYCFISLLFAIPIFAKELKPYPSTAELPKNIRWETKESVDHFPGYKPKKGGKLVSYMLSYPQTFRLYGPNSNSGSFVSYNREYTISMSLTTIDPNTFEFVPVLSTHWAIMPDNKTIYYKLDPDARWSDGKKITADDYLFAYEFLRSPFIKSPYTNRYLEEHFESVDKIDDYTIRMVAKKPSWRVLVELDFSPLPRHFHQLDDKWVERYQWKPNPAPGPYVLKKFKKNRYVEFHRIKNWWGYGKAKFRHLYHFDKIRLETIRNDDIAFEQFKKGKLSLFRPTSLIWQNKTNFEAVQKGYIKKRRFYTESFSGASGLFFNTQDPIWKDVNLRTALAHSIDFETMNKNLFFNLYKRKHNYFDVAPPYKIKGMKSHEFDIEKAQALLEKSGWKRTPTSQGYREKDGQRLILEVFTGSESSVRYLSFIQQTAAKAGIEMKINQRDGASYFQIMNQRNFDAIILSFGGSFYPSPRQMLHTEFIQPNTNNIFMFGSPKIDQLIETYEFNLDESKRIDAISEIEKIVKKYVPIILLQESDSERILFWNYIKSPDKFGYKRGIDIDLLYYDPEAKEALETAIDDEKSLPVFPVDFDPYQLRQ